MISSKRNSPEFRSMLPSNHLNARNSVASVSLSVEVMGFILILFFLSLCRVKCDTININKRSCFRIVTLVLNPPGILAIRIPPAVVAILGDIL
jgi:hypothetical protein